MPSAYLLARDKVEQSRVMLSSDLWFDAELDHYFSLLLERLQLLDAKTIETNSGPPSPEAGKKVIPLVRDGPKRPDTRIFTDG